MKVKVKKLKRDKVTPHKEKLDTGYPWQPGRYHDNRQEKIEINFYRWLKNMEKPGLEPLEHEAL